MRQGNVLLVGACSLAVTLAASCSDETEDDGTTSSGTGGATSTSGTGGSTGGGGASSTSGSGGSTSTSGTGGGGGGVGGGDSSVDCDGAPCSSNEVCCWSGDTLSCVDTQSCSGIQVHCDEPSDCPGQVCCFQQNDFLCVGNCPGAGAEVCDDGEDCSGSASHCCPYTTSSPLPTVCSAAPC